MILQDTCPFPGAHFQIPYPYRTWGRQRKKVPSLKLTKRLKNDAWNIGFKRPCSGAILVLGRVTMMDFTSSTSKVKYDYFTVSWSVSTSIDPFGWPVLESKRRQRATFEGMLMNCMNGWGFRWSRTGVCWGNHQLTQIQDQWNDETGGHQGTFKNNTTPMQVWKPWKSMVALDVLLFHRTPENTRKERKSISKSPYIHPRLKNMGTAPRSQALFQC